MEINEVKKLIPNTVLKDFDGIVDGTVLGASNHIKMIANMFVEISKNNNVDVCIENIKVVSQYFKETRGKSSYAIINALDQIESLIDSGEGDINSRVSNAVELYFITANKNNEKIFEYTDRLLKDVNCVMLFDYSSTVEKSIVNCSHKLKVYIPESRVINGGYPFVKGIVDAGHTVHFIADAAMLSVLDSVEMVFIGAETFYPDGTAFNTVGSDILAELCSFHHIPYYVLTPLLKSDARALQGIFKPILTKDLSNTLTINWDETLKNKVDFTSIELVGVKPELITGYVTEKGILKPSSLIQFTYKEEV